MIKRLFTKYKELIVYIIFGVLTTLFNWGVYWVSLRLFAVVFTKNTILVGVSNIIAWVLAVIFAYVTNKIWVFESKSWKKDIVVKEVIGFVSARGLTGAIEEVALVGTAAVHAVQAFSVSVLSFNLTGNMICKIIVSIIVMVLNYVFSKFFIFKDKDKKEKQQNS